MSGDCEVVGDCVQSSNYPSTHGNDESCSITMLEDATVTVGDTFDLETCCDHLMIRGVDTESADAVPATLNAGEVFSWTTDGSVSRNGWQLCFSEFSTTVEPTRTTIDTTQNLECILTNH